MSKLDLPENLKLNLKKYKDLRYGENPHQQSAYYMSDGDSGYEQFSGIELSHNNLGDANHAWRLVSEFTDPTVAIIKHGNPSGIATRTVLDQAYKLAYEADSVSAFGGVFFELIVAPDFSKEVLVKLKEKSSKLRVVKAQKPPDQLEFTRVFNGYLVQTPDNVSESRLKWKIVCGTQPSKKTFDDLEFAWKVVKHVKSNAIVIARDLSMLGMGTGQPNRVNAVKLALEQAKSRSAGAILASDAFFPFADNVELAARAGISVIHDKDVIEAAKKHNMTMVFTGVRHFKH